MKKLEEYESKRNFDLTKEPSGKNQKVKSGKKLKFAVQHHIATKDHYDFRLEWDGVLLSWAVPKGPSFFATDKRLAIKVEDHPIFYGNFEGNIPKGQYGGGVVMLWDKGTYLPLVDIQKGLEKGVLKFELFGKRLVGKWVLFRIDEKKGKEQWILNKENDEFEGKTDISTYFTSIKSGKTMSQIENGVKKNHFSKMIKTLNKIKDEEVNIGNMKISSPNKILSQKPKIKKIEMLQYYALVAKRMLPFLQNRIASIVRCPEGLLGECFFKKHPDSNFDGVEKIVVKNKKGEEDTFFCISNLEGLIYEAQMNTIEFHVWGSTTNDIEKPDMMIFDLDPDEKLGIREIRQGVKDLKSILDELGLDCFLKTSGGKGYHIFVPFLSSVSWDDFSAFAQNVSKIMEQKWEDKYTSNIRKDSRKGKIFIDWQRNTRGSTTVAPYSLRAKRGMCVSMPIFWEELDCIEPNSIGIKEAIQRLEKKDPWKDFFKIKQKLK